MCNRPARSDPSLPFEKLMHFAFSRTLMPSLSRISADGFGDILVFAANQPRSHLDDRDFAAEAPEHLPELEPDITAADDDQMLREEVDLEHRAVGEELDLLEPRHVRHGRAAADVDEDPIGREAVRPDADLARRFKPRVAFEDGAVLHASQPTLKAVPRLRDDGVLPRLHALHVHGRRRH